jgi:hypothetical protein
MSTPNLAIATIASNQASKEVTANTALSQLDTALTDVLSHTMTDADYGLTDPGEARRYMVFLFTGGSLTADRNILVPNSKKLYVVSNQTTGGKNLIVKTAAGTGITIPPDSLYYVLYCNATNVVQVSGGGKMGGVNAQSGATYTLTAVDKHKLVTFSNVGVAVTVPQAGTAGFDNDWFCYIENRAAGTVTITPTTSTIDGAASLSLAQNQGIVIFSDGTNYFTNRGMGSGGSGGGSTIAAAYVVAQAPDAPPTTPTTLDDEFNGTSLDPKWTWVNQGGATTSFKNGVLALNVPQVNGSNQRLIVQTAPGTPWEVTVKLLGLYPPSGTSSAGIVLRESGTGKLIRLVLVYSTGTFPTIGWGYGVFKDTNPTTFNATAFSIGDASVQYQYLKVKDDGTNLIFYLSPDGLIWNQVYSEGRTVFMAGGPNQVGLVSENNAVTGPALEATFEFFRRTDTYTPAAVPPIANGFVTAGPPDAPPASPTIYDDEFNGTALDAKWTKINTGTGSDITVGNSRAQLTRATGTQVWTLAVQNRPAAPYQIDAKFTLDARLTNYSYCGLVLRDSATGHFVALRLSFENVGGASPFARLFVDYWNGTGPSQFSGSSTIGSTIVPPSPLIYLRIKDDGTNFILNYSFDGIQWDLGATWTLGRTVFLPGTYDQMGIGIAADNNTQPAQATCDWFRRTDGGYVPITIPSVSINADTKPTSPNSMDDEFETTTLDSKWTLVNQGSAVYSLVNGNLVINCPTSVGENNFLFVQATPGTPWEITAKISPESALTGYCFANLVVRESSTGKFIRWGPEFRQAPSIGKFLGAANFTNPTTYAGTSPVSDFAYEWANELYVRIKDDGTNLIFSTSRNGLTWTQWGTVGRTAHMAGGPNQVGLCLGPTSMAVAMAVDWFRRTA